MRSARPFPLRSWNSSASSPTTPAAHPARSTRAAHRTLALSEATGASRFSKGFRPAGSANASARSTALAKASGAGDGTSAATRATALPLTIHTASSSAAASSMTARFGPEGISGRDPSVPSLSETSNSGRANTRRFSIRRRSSATDQASSRSSGNLVARSKGSSTRCSPKGRSYRARSSDSASTSRERRNRSDSPPGSNRRPKAHSARSSRSWSRYGPGGDSPRLPPKGTGNNPSPSTSPAASSTTAC